MTDTVDPLKGYRGRARAKLEALGMRVWSDVRLVNTAGSVFEGVVLPRSGNFDDLHIVLKLKTGYNVGVHVDRVERIEELGQRCPSGGLALCRELLRGIGAIAEKAARLSAFGLEVARVMARRLVRALEMLRDKRQSNLPRKHGNIPL